MQATLTILGVVCLIAAIVGGGLEAAGTKLPVVSSRLRQLLLAVVGIGLIAAENIRLPDLREPSIPAAANIPLGDGNRASDAETSLSDKNTEAAAEVGPTVGKQPLQFWERRLPSVPSERLSWNIHIFQCAASAPLAKMFADILRGYGFDPSVETGGTQLITNEVDYPSDADQYFGETIAALLQLKSGEDAVEARKSDDPNAQPQVLYIYAGGSGICAK